jgi:hypothetical protein
MNDQETTNEAACGGSALTAELGADFDDAEERYIHQTLAMLQESYAKAAKPYIDRLVAIRSLRPLQMVVTREQAEAMGFTVPNAKITGPL